MKTALQILAVLPLLATSVVATNPSTTCRTELGTKSTNHVSTVTKTSTSSHQPTKTVTIRPTVTTYVGLWYTVTGFATKTKTVTDSTVTDTFSTTSTVFAVETDTITSTVTTTTTNTDTASSTSTTVVPTTQGFQNIQDTINSDVLQRRALDHPHVPRAQVQKPQGLKASMYPTKVDCMLFHSILSTKQEHMLTHLQAPRFCPILRPILCHLPRTQLRKPFSIRRRLPRPALLPLLRLLFPLMSHQPLLPHTHPA
jgi:hypothetical protein